jgi:ferredoxin--NADP+ reductase/benzoate/toluate 1,2-dioxygenase reductase subunit
MQENTIKPVKNQVKVQQIRHLSESVYVLRFDRNGHAFEAGQHVILGLAGKNNGREYSVYSGEQDDFFEVLIKEVQEGDISRKLRKVQPGDLLEMDGPLGFFTLDPDQVLTKKFVFIATGTGIAPFRSFVKSFPGLDYKILHGVRFGHEAIERQNYDAARFQLCTSGDSSGDLHGRVTGYLTINPADKNSEYYLCGNVKMIHQAFDILKGKGISSDQMHAEVYF